MNSYSVLSKIYDELMEKVDYKDWAMFIHERLELSEAKPMHHILELGCGTGNVTKELLKLGYEVVGVDISQEMLEVAEEKLEKYGDKIILINQDICELEFDVYEIDSVVCCNDTFNYILDEVKIKGLLEYLYPRMKNGGVLIFDISSEYKLEKILGNNTFGESFDDMVYLWGNFYNEEEKTVSMDIDFFLKDKQSYERFSEFHIQKAHSDKTLTNIIKEAGFKNIRLYGDFSREEGIEDKTERIFFVCEK
ncbi:MAG: class I SAM-dependent DNA methyltransferase [Filifactoraceae bacterium]